MYYVVGQATGVVDGVVVVLHIDIMGSHDHLGRIANTVPDAIEQLVRSVQSRGDSIGVKLAVFVAPGDEIRIAYLVGDGGRYAVGRVGYVLVFSAGRGQLGEIYSEPVIHEILLVFPPPGAGRRRVRGPKCRWPCVPRHRRRG